MSNFNALNIESDQSSDEEIDDTKELQIEDALKLYQTALRYHAQGFESQQQALNAYQALFESEIFRYPESVSELRRFEAHDGSVEFDNAFYDTLETTNVQSASRSDTAPSALPNVLYLSYKNHGLFMLDLLQTLIRERGSLLQPHIRAIADQALSFFTEALDKDDADQNLWMRTSAAAKLLGSIRTSRYGFEAVLEDDGDGLGSVLSLPGLEEAAASECLRQLVEALEDVVALAQPPLSKARGKRISKVLSERFVPLAQLEPYALKNDITPAAATRITLAATDGTWAAVGEVLLNQFFTEQSSVIQAPPSIILLDVPLTAAPRASNTIESELSNQPHTTEMDHDTTSLRSNEGVSSLKGQEEQRSSKKTESDLDCYEDRPSGDPNHRTNDKITVDAKAVNLPTRKRSTESAGLPENADSGRVRSKRIRARESIGEAATGEFTAEDMARQYEEQLEPFSHADHWLFETVGGLLRKLGCQEIGSSHDLKAMAFDDKSASPKQDDLHHSHNVFLSDMYTCFSNWTEDRARIVFHGDVNEAFGFGARNAGLTAFLGHANAVEIQAADKPVLYESSDLSRMVETVNTGHLNVRQTAYLWLQCLIRKDALDKEDPPPEETTYKANLWPDRLKNAIVQVIVRFDEFIYAQVADEVRKVVQSNRKPLRAGAPGSNSAIYLVDMVQTLFELHLDIHFLIKQPNSGVDLNTQTSQKDRVERWAILARNVMNMDTKDNAVVPENSELFLRHSWASVFLIGINTETIREHVISCLEDLKRVFDSAGGPVIRLQNNAIMPELSVAAADREISRLTTKDFFLGLFEQDTTDPVAVIESLEPILDGTSSGRAVDGAAQGHHDTPLLEVEMFKFLEQATISVRLSLWQRLKEAYQAIEYPAKVISCQFRCVELIMAELRASSYADGTVGQRQFHLLNWLRTLEGLVSKICDIVRTSVKDAFQCFDDAHLRTSLDAVTDLLRLLHMFTIYEDRVRVGQVAAPLLVNGRPSLSFPILTAKIHDCQVRLWILFYLLCKESLALNTEKFARQDEDRFDILRSVHLAFGIRKYCNAADKWLLKLLQVELLQMRDVSFVDEELAQVLYDLYGLKCFSNPADCQEHGIEPEVLTRSSASQILDLVLHQARKVNIKDLLKMDLRLTIDKVHMALGKSKQTESMTRNQKVYQQYIKSPINPLNLYNCFQGIPPLSSVPISAGQPSAGSKGWYYLQGMINLTKFRAVKRVSSTPTDDLNVAIAFFAQDLEHRMDNWETWYRLAQANDSLIEENVVWNADKLNSGSPELVVWQRQAVHCYVMATALAMGTANVSLENARKVAEMYAEFGMRIYASSRPPFNMQAFSIKDFDEKYFSGSTMYKGPAFTGTPLFSVWKVASVLYQKAVAVSPDIWTHHFMLGKCLWKMHVAQDSVAANRLLPSAHQVLQALIRAVEVLPKRRDRRQEPILEPHYKLVAVVHKLVQRGDLEAGEGSEYIQKTPYARKVRWDEAEDWESCVLQTLKALRTADKSGWHHRLIARAAHIIFDNKDPHMRHLCAMGAKVELTQQTFTKTMQIQVWKPEHERAGRHFVYTSRYVLFFLEILSVLGDRENLKQLSNRVKKKPNDFFEHTRLWHDFCTTYLKVLRRYGKVPEGHEDTVFKNIDHDKFTERAPRLAEWCHAHLDESIPLLETLRDVLELKKLNSNLIKTTLIDDLIGDAYAALYETMVPSLELNIQMEQEETRPTVTDAAAAAADCRVPGGAGGVPQSDTIAAAVSDGVPKTRLKGVGRREVGKYAEQCITVPPPVSKRPPSDSFIGVVIPPRQTNAAAEGAESSGSGSVHDDADDESELSELVDDDDDQGNEEEGVPALAPPPMFPGLVHAANMVPDSEEEGNSEYDDAPEEMEMSETVQEEVGLHPVQASGE